MVGEFARRLIQSKGGGSTEDASKQPQSRKSRDLKKKREGRSCRNKEEWKREPKCIRPSSLTKRTSQGPKTKKQNERGIEYQRRSRTNGNEHVHPSQTHPIPQTLPHPRQPTNSPPPRPLPSHSHSPSSSTTLSPPPSLHSLLRLQLQSSVFSLLPDFLLLLRRRQSFRLDRRP